MRSHFSLLYIFKYLLEVRRETDGLLRFGEQTITLDCIQKANCNYGNLLEGIVQHHAI